MTHTVHFLAPMLNPYGGTEHETLDTWRLLSRRASINLWSLGSPHDDFRAVAPIRSIDERGVYPTHGVLVVFGAFYPLGDWLSRTQFSRIVIIYNTDTPRGLSSTIRTVRSKTHVEPEVVYVSRALRRQGLPPGPVSPSPVCPSRYATKRLPSRGPMIVGRVSRDVPEKHGEEDPELYMALLEEGFEIRILGGTCLRDRLPEHPHLFLLKAGAVPVPEFLRELTCFVYRTSSTWFEAFGRVIFEAMAAGRPVVAEARGGYTEWLTHERDALLFHTTAEAVDYVGRLRDSEGLAEELGMRGAVRCQEVYDTTFQKRLAALLCDPRGQW